jgi:hypothetical protein
VRWRPPIDRPGWNKVISGNESQYRSSKLGKCKLPTDGAIFLQLLCDGSWLCLNTTESRCGRENLERSSNLMNGCVRNSHTVTSIYILILLFTPVRCLGQHELSLMSWRWAELAWVH